MDEHPDEPATAYPPPKDEEFISNILPSYHMFQLTILKHLRPLNENFSDEPPVYEDLVPLLAVTTPGPSTPFSLLTVVLPLDHPQQVDDLFFPIHDTDEQSQGYENTILANIHKLPNLSKRDMHVLNSLEINITVTQNVCQIGQKPTIINPLDYEYSQGDFIHGYVTILNKLDTPIPFDMVYVCFEGSIVVLENKRGLIDTETPHTVFKFLSTLDLFALWTFANIDRLATDKGDPHDWCYGEIDPQDGTYLSIDAKRLLLPGLTYKRMFSFRIPEKLLDDACDPHGFALHTELPSTLGVPRHLIPPSVLLAAKELLVRDFSFADTSVNYSVDCRIIGKALEYQFAVSGQDQYVVAQEKLLPVRVVPHTNLEIVYMRKTLEDEARVFYKALCDLVREKVNMGQDLLKLPQKRRLAWLNRATASAKIQQLYEVTGSQNKRPLDNEKAAENLYRHLSPYKKKLLTGLSKLLGIIALTTPKQAYTIEYIPPLKHRKRGAKYETIVTVPVELCFYPEEQGKSPPEVKLTLCELMVLTVRLKRHPFPFEIVHDMCFHSEEVDTKRREADTFDDIVIKPFTEYSQQLSQLIKSVGNDTFRLESQVYRDVKLVATATSKTVTLLVRDLAVQVIQRSASLCGVHTAPQLIAWLDHGDYKSKSFALRVDLGELYIKGSDKQLEQITLVPSSQLCLVARVYYLRVVVKLTLGELPFVHVPVYIEKRAPQL